MKVIIIRKEIKVENKELQCFFFSQKTLSTQFLTSHLRYDKYPGPKLINTKKTPIGLIGVVLITIKKP